MGIVNVTPDSFSDGGRYRRPAAAREHASQLCLDGADILDVGGESTRPGAAPVSVAEELDRVIPVIEAIAGDCDIPISVDTSKPQVMREAVKAGAGLINDVRALTEPDALTTAAELGVPVCLMHMQGAPSDMQRNPQYEDALAEVVDWLKDRRDNAVAAGIPPHQLLYDPGFGFGKRLEHNLALLSGIGTLAALGPVIAGLSRKRMIGELLGDDACDRTLGSVTAGLLAVARGASVLRVHDVAETHQAVTVWHESGVAQGLQW